MAFPRSSRPSPHSISLFSLTALVVANMVGSGVFTSLGFQLVSLRSPFVLLALWLIGGLCALCGALCYAELGTALCRSGGEYNFLSEIYGKPVGFLAGWLSGTIGFAAPVALAAMALGGYVHRIAPALASIDVAIGTILAVTVVHLLRPIAGSVFQNTFTTVKVVFLAAFIAIGAFHGLAEPVSFLPRPGDVSLMTGQDFAISLVFVMYAFSGWNASTYVVSEAGDPRRTIPRSLFLGTGLVLLLYIGLNWVFLWTTPMEAMTGQLEVGLIAAASMLGPGLGGLMGGAIALLLVSTISSMIRVGPRVIKTMGEDYPALRVFTVQSSNGIPYVAVLFQGLVSLLLVVTGTFERVLIFAQFPLLLCTFLAALGVVVLRILKPELPRPYRTWGYPVTPILFLGISLWMIVYVIRGRPLEALLGTLILALGLGVYFVIRPRRASLRVPAA